MIKVNINKKEQEIEESVTVAMLLEEFGSKRSAVWVNGQQLLVAQYPTYTFQDGDEVKILRIVAGG